MAEVKAMACELPAKSGVPVSRWSATELARQAVEGGIVAQVSGTTVWRWLAQDAIRPWNYRSWIFPRDPRLAERAGPMLDLYHGRWEGQLLQPDDFVVCADENPSIQARARKLHRLDVRGRGSGRACLMPIHHAHARCRSRG